MNGTGGRQRPSHQPMRSVVSIGAIALFCSCSSQSEPPLLSADLVTATMDGPAMEPTIHAGARVTVNLGVSATRGEVVLIDLPGHHRSIRRIVAVGGEGIVINGATSPAQVGISEPGSSI